MLEHILHNDGDILSKGGISKVVSYKNNCTKYYIGFY